MRRYLRALGVPLYVWVVGAKKGAALYPEWGEVRAVRSLRDLRRAVRDLEADLKRQKILWVDGRHLPQSLEIAAGARVASVGR